MNKKRFILCLTIVFFAVSLLGSSCQEQPHEFRPFNRPALNILATNITANLNAPTPATTPVETEFIQSTLDFSIDLFKRSFLQDSNILVSPLSVMLALAMTANGADGQTLSQMEDVLANGMSIDRVNSNLFSYRASLESCPNSILEIANSIWIRNNIRPHINDDFLKTNKSFFDACAFSAPFNAQTVSDINNWVSHNTFGMIDRVIESIGADNIMYLINTIAFYAEWEARFGGIHKRDFVGVNSNTQSVDFMHGSSNQMISGSNFTGFIKPYLNNQYSFVALLPNWGTSISTLVASLTGERFKNAFNRAWREPVEIIMPKFEFDFNTSLVPVLNSMGIVDAFNLGAADFSKMSPAPLGIHIGDILHNTFISVDEAGTRAAAATTVVMVSCAAERPWQITLDRPFVFAIMDNLRGVPLFLGTLLNV
ncbi:MAG: serpin family protein [Firmicutes bacterium]|nr:serpin family protein [Bacillota bacterium]